MDDIKAESGLGDTQVQNIISDISSAVSEGTEEKKKASVGSRDIQVSALLHLLGLPTKDEFKVLEKKVDLLGNKLSSLSAKLDRMLSEISQAEIIGAVERAETQVADLKAILKKVLPKVAVSVDSGEHASVEDGSQSKIPKVDK